MGLWKERNKRILSRAHMHLTDICCAFDWYVKGGKHFFETYAHEIISAHKWCFIGCCNNSGSSLLQSILENSGQVSTMPQEGQRYTTTLERCHRKGHERVWGEFIQDLRMTEDDSLKLVPRLVHDWMKILKSPTKEVIVEKTTANAVRMRWLQQAFPNSYFIGLVRNGFAVSEGIRRKGGKTLERGAHHWNLVNKVMLQDAKCIRNYLEIRYEDIVENFEETSKKLGKFLDLDQVKIYEAMTGKFNFTTINTQNSQSITNLNKDSINRLSKSDIEIINNVASEMLLHFGYMPKLEHK